MSVCMIRYYIYAHQVLYTCLKQNELQIVSTYYIILYIISEWLFSGLPPFEISIFH